MARMVIHPTYRYPNGLQEGPPAERAFWAAGKGRRAGLVLAAALLALLLAAAWVLTNLSDAAPTPRPAELALPQPRLAPERNAAFVLLGLHAAADRDAGRAGREVWALRQKAGNGPEPAALAAQQAALTGTPLAQPQGAPWDCNALAEDCVAVYRDRADALAVQRQVVAAQGARCDALVDSAQPDKALSLEELLPAAWTPTAELASHLDAANVCAQWFNTGAVLAHRQGRRDEALRLLARSSQWHRTLIAGSHTLLAQMSAHDMARRYLRVVSGLAAQEPALAAQLLPLAASFGAPEQLARRWVVTEAAFSHGAFRATAPAAEGWSLQRLLWQRERTLQLMDQQWLGLLKRVDAGLPGALASTGPEDDPSWLRGWRNPAGRAQVDLARPAYNGYLARHLDLELHREAAALALNVQRLAIAPAARADWARQQALSPALQQRLSWSADGRTLSVRKWSADSEPAGQPAEPRHRIDITLDRAAAG